MDMAKTMEPEDGESRVKPSSPTRCRARQAWNSIFRPGSIFRKGYTDSPRNRSYVIMNSCCTTCTR